MVWIEFAILLACILIGSRIKGVGLGVMGMICMLIYTLIFHMQPADPPVEVMLIILSVVSAAAALQAAGGMDYLVRLAEKLLQSRPGQIVFLGRWRLTVLRCSLALRISIIPSCRLSLKFLRANASARSGR